MRSMWLAAVLGAISSFPATPRIVSPRDASARTSISLGVSPAGAAGLLFVAWPAAVRTASTAVPSEFASVGSAPQFSGGVLLGPRRAVRPLVDLFSER